MTYSFIPANSTFTECCYNFCFELWIAAHIFATISKSLSYLQRNHDCMTAMSTKWYILLWYHFLIYFLFYTALWDNPRGQLHPLTYCTVGWCSFFDIFHLFTSDVGWADAYVLNRWICLFIILIILPFDHSQLNIMYFRTRFLEGTSLLLHFFIRLELSSLQHVWSDGGWAVDSLLLKSHLEQQSCIVIIAEYAITHVSCDYSYEF